MIKGRRAKTNESVYIDTRVKLGWQLNNTQIINKPSLPAEAKMSGSSAQLFFSRRGRPAEDSVD